MGLTSGTGPFGHDPAGRFNFAPDPPTGSVLYFDPVPYRLRGFFAGEAVFDTLNAKLLYETAHLAVYYMPEEDLQHELLEPSDKQTHCPHKGAGVVPLDPRWRPLRAGRGLELPGADRPGGVPLRSRGVLLGEARRVVGGGRAGFRAPARPIPPHRHVPHDTPGARLGRRRDLVAESTRAVALFESGLPPRFYLPAEDVRMELLEPSETKTRCAYKGVASYWHVRAGETLHEDLAWTYPEPERDALSIRDLICFFNERVDLEVGGEAQERPVTQWSH